MKSELCKGSWYQSLLNDYNYRKNINARKYYSIIL